MCPGGCIAHQNSCTFSAKNNFNLSILKISNNLLQLSELINAVNLGLPDLLLNVQLGDDQQGADAADFFRSEKINVSKKSNFLHFRGLELA